MASLEEKIAYLKGYAEALDIKPDTSEGKLLLKIVETLSDVSESITDINDIQDDLYDDDCDCDCDCDDDDECIGEIECPDCGEVFELTDDMFEEDTIACPNCGKVFNLEIDCDDDGCGCGCHDEH